MSVIGAFAAAVVGLSSGATPVDVGQGVATAAQPTQLLAVELSASRLSNIDMLYERVVARSWSLTAEPGVGAGWSSGPVGLSSFGQDFTVTNWSVGLSGLLGARFFPQQTAPEGFWLGMKLGVDFLRQWVATSSPQFGSSSSAVSALIFVGQAHVGYDVFSARGFLVSLSMYGEAAFVEPASWGVNLGFQIAVGKAF